MLILSQSLDLECDALVLCLAEEGRASMGVVSHVHLLRQKQKEDSQVLAALPEHPAEMVVLVLRLVILLITCEDHLLLISK